jgi:hypothetical protein
MSLSSHAALLDAGDFPGALAAWRAEFSGREDSLEASWELAEIEERWGDSLFFSADFGSASHYQAAQRALIPPGAMFSSSEENQRRMEAYGRLTNKLYAIGGDGKPRLPHDDAQPHPRFKTNPPREETAPPQKSKVERREAVAEARKTRTKDQSELGRLYGTDQWAHHRLGELWLKAATALARNHQQLAQIACEWSYHHFEHYNRLWTAHLPASRFDSDGHEEMMEVGSLQNSLATGAEESPAPEWVPPLLDGDWQTARAALGPDAPAPVFEPLAALLADACKTADGMSE